VTTPDPVETSRARSGHLLAATLFCETCGEATPHRLLKSTVTRDGAVSGIARCRDCRTVHLFAAPVARTAPLRVVLSDGRASTRSELALPADTVLTLGERLPSAPAPWRIQRLEGPNGRSLPTGTVRTITTAWVVVDRGAQIPVSLIEGRRTVPLRYATPPDRELGVGDAIEVEGRALTIVALRAQGQTWRRFGDRFAAGAIVRLYTRRTVSPPAGRSDWSRERESPTSRARAISTSARARSSPGVSRR
jgi:uncharacterized Zn finger protein